MEVWTPPAVQGVTGHPVCPAGTPANYIRTTRVPGTASVRKKDICREGEPLEPALEATRMNCEHSQIGVVVDR